MEMDPEAMRHKLIRYDSVVRIYLGVILFLVFTAGMIFYIQHETLKSTPLDQCTTQLAIAKKQLEVETEYKKRVEKLLTDTQEYYEADREQFRYSMDNCFEMTQQAFLCQKNLNDESIKCSKVKLEYDKMQKQLKDIKCGKNKK